MEHHSFYTLFGTQWKNKYNLDYCYLCDTAVIICPVCNNGSCSGGGCDECKVDFIEFLRLKIHPEAYLTSQEAISYQKGIRLQKLIVESLGRQEKELDFTHLKEQGYLSLNDELLLGVN